MPNFIKRLFSPVQKSSQALMVLGMHRSGTSFLTGSLQEAGLELGEHSSWNPHNLKGNRESQAVVGFHDAVLQRHGYSWDNPNEHALTWTPGEVRQAESIIAGYRGVAHWGFKDPRSLLFVGNWQSLLPGLQFIGIFRHPAAVARSLDARGGMSLQQAHRLWRIYNQHLLLQYQRSPFPLLCFDEDEGVLHAKLDQVMDSFGFRPPQGDRFFSAELKHHHPVEEPLDSELAAIYRQLQALAI